MHVAQRFSLDLIEIDDPCPMAGLPVPLAERQQYCDHCHKTVHNLSAMTRTEAERLVCERAGPMCVQYSRSRSGEVITLDSQPQARRSLRWMRLSVLCAFLGAPLAFFGFARAGDCRAGGLRPMPRSVVTTQPSSTQPSATQPALVPGPNVCDDQESAPVAGGLK